MHVYANRVATSSLYEVYNGHAAPMAPLRSRQAQPHRAQPSPSSLLKCCNGRLNGSNAWTTSLRNLSGVCATASSRSVSSMATVGHASCARDVVDLDFASSEVATAKYCPYFSLPRATVSEIAIGMAWRLTECRIALRHVRGGCRYLGSRLTRSPCVRRLCVGWQRSDGRRHSMETRRNLRERRLRAILVR